MEFFLSLCVVDREAGKEVLVGGDSGSRTGRCDDAVR
jgi:hypothetical protein